MRQGDGTAFKTDAQKAWQATVRVMSTRFTKFRKEQLLGGMPWAQKVVDTSWFRRMVDVAIAVNIVIMLAEHYQQSVVRLCGFACVCVCVSVSVSVYVCMLRLP